MKTRVEFDKDDYNYTHYTIPMLFVVSGVVFLGMTCLFIILRIKNNDSAPDYFWPVSISMAVFSMVCLFPYGLLMVFPFGRTIHKESCLNVTEVKTGTTDSIKQLYSVDGYRYQPGRMKSPLYFRKKPYKPGELLKVESTITPSDFNVIKAACGKYYGAYLIIDGEKYLIMSSTWFKEGDYVWIKYYPKSKIVLEMDYANDGDVPHN